jgi:hypothetical protein
VFNEEEKGWLKFTYSGSAEDPEFAIETKFPTYLKTSDMIEYMAQMLFYVHSGALIEDNANVILDSFREADAQEIGVMILKRWEEFEVSHARESLKPCVPPSEVFDNKKGIV